MTAPMKGTVLTREQRDEIRRELEHYPEPRAATVEALKVVQRHHRWVSDEAVAEVAELLGMTPAEVDNVATFYNLVFREPVGEHVILLCDSVSCWLLEEPALRRRLTELLGIRPGQTTDDGQFTLLPVPCLGACDGAPALMIDDDLHTNVTLEGLHDLLARYRAGGSR